MVPKISVCIPTYNGEAFLEKCLQSIGSQTLRDIEIVITDDRSKDRTLEIARRSAQLDNRIKIFENPNNLGPIGNFNRCFYHAKGEWIKFLCQDDVMSKPDLLEKMYSHADSEIGIVYCRRQYTFEPGVKEEVVFWFKNTLKQFSDIYPGKSQISAAEVRQAALKYLLMNIFGEPSALLLKRSLVSKYGVFNKNLIQIGDAELPLRIASNRGMVFINEPSVDVHYHAKSASSQNARRHYRSEVLEQLIFLHEINFNPLLNSLREEARRLNPPVNLLTQFAYKARKAKASALKDPACREEWEKIIKLYPAIHVCASRVKILSNSVKKIFSKVGVKNI